MTFDGDEAYAPARIINEYLKKVIELAMYFKS